MSDVPIRELFVSDFRRLEGQPTPQFFSGSVDESTLTFRISRYITYRNSFLPLLIGSASVHGAHTMVRIHARPSWPVTVFTVVWLVGVSGALLSSGSAGFPWYIQFGMPLFAVFLYFGAFMPELVTAWRALSELIGPDRTHSGPEA